MRSRQLQQFEQALVEQQLITDTSLSQLKNSAECRQVGLFETLLNQKSISPQKLYQMAANTWATPWLDLNNSEFETANTPELPPNVLKEIDAVVVLNQQKRLMIAFGSPDKLESINQLSFYSPKPMQPALADLNLIRKINFEQSAHHKNPANPASLDKSLNDYLEKSAQLRASDIHIEMFAAHCAVRVRVDGVLHQLASANHRDGLKLISQIKLIANMDIAQSRLPQDGRFSHQLSNKTISLRVNSLPTIHGEKIVLRLLDQHGKKLKLDQLGLNCRQYKKVREILQQPSGMILVCGPTGSGKTVTLYAMLELLNTGKENISTIEDPAEIQVDGINQINVNRKAGLDFSLALRALLRQDPDIIMVGEIRDGETAEIAVKAAQTGHLVLATLHSRSAASAITRLAQLGIDHGTLIEALKLVIGQRLLRLLCHHCRQPQDVSTVITQHFRQASLAPPENTYRAHSCPQCLQGYSGRTGIFEFYTPGEDHLNEKTLLHAGLSQIADGKTSFDEFLRIY